MECDQKPATQDSFELFWFPIKERSHVSCEIENCNVAEIDQHVSV